MKTKLLIATSLILLTACKAKEPPAKQSIQTATVRLVHSAELRSYLGLIKERFTTVKPELPDGTRINIELVQEQGLSAAKKLASGEIKAEAWLAPSSSLIDYTNSHLKDFGSRQVDCVKLFESPIVMATLPRHLDQFNLSNGQFSWQGIFETRMLQSQTEIPDSPYIAYSHGFPEISPTGFPALLELAYLATSRKNEMLSVDWLKAEHIKSMLKKYETIISSYAESEPSILERVANSGAKRIRMGITSEQQVFAFNRNQPPGAPNIVEIFPDQGSVMLDYHICASGADWVAPAYRATVKFLTQYLASEESQNSAVDFGFRPAIKKDADLSHIYSVVGTNSQSLPAHLFPNVSGEVIQYISDEWPNLMRPAALLVILDTSGSMDGEPLQAAREIIRNLVATLPSQDTKALVSFGSESKVESSFSSDNIIFIQALDRLKAVGGSSAYDAIRAGIQQIIAPEQNPYRRTILMITDGEGGNSELSLQGIQDYVNNKLARYDINLIIVGFKHEGNGFPDLEKITRSANGIYREATPEQLANTIQELAKNF